MKILDLTFSRPEDNLACDDALLEAAEDGACGETLRFWEPQNYFVVLGYSNKAALEINRDACRTHRVPVFRRVSGGGTVLQGRGCLNYSLVLDFKSRPGFGGIRTTNETVMEKNCAALRKIAGPGVSVKGITDLALGDLKFSGNAQRRKSRFLLFHGTFLLDFDLARIEDLLAVPPLQPDYRQNRRHGEFVTNLGVPSADVKKRLAEEWGAEGGAKVRLEEKMRALVEERYSQESWNYRF